MRIRKKANWAGKVEAPVTEWRYVTFPSTFFAIRADRALSRHQIRHQIVPVPRMLSSSCGSALRFEPALRDQVLEVLTQEGVEIEAEYLLGEQEGKLHVLD